MKRLGVVLAVGLGVGCVPADSLFCDGAGCAFSSREWARLSALARSNLGPPPADLSNASAGNLRAMALGQRFFSDARFSGVSKQVDALGRPATVGRAPAGDLTNLSCVSCHDLPNGGADTVSVPGNVSSGAGWTDVNALPIANLAYEHLYTWNGRADSLWAQAFAVAENPLTMNGDRLNTMHVIFDNYYADYAAVFGPAPLSIAPGQSVYPDHGKPGVAAYDSLPADVQDAITRVQVNWAKALAAYEATLVTGDAPFDRFIAEGPTSDAISAAAKRGARLFVGKAACIDCHSTPLFSDGDFHDVGVPQNGPDVPTLADCPAGNATCDCTGAGSKCLPWGAYDGLAKLKMSSMTRTSKWSDKSGDLSRDADVKKPLTDALKGAWRTPSLRNVARTGPYMHDGVYASLDDVVAHYSRGPDPGAVGTPAADIKPLLLSVGEQADLVAFLNTLNADVVTASISGSGGPTGGGGSPGGPPDAGAVGGSAGGGPPPHPSGLPCDVQTLLQSRCQTCHSAPPVNGAPFSLVSYADVMTYANFAVIAMTSGEMPPGGPQATAAEIATLQRWIDAGYPMGSCPVGPPQFACSGTPPSTAQLTGSPLSPAAAGPVYQFAGTGVPPLQVMTSASGPGFIDAIQVVAAPGIVPDPANAYLGFGLPFGYPGCVDARAYNAVRFTVIGDLGSCAFKASLVTSEDNATANGPFGTCGLGAACVPPFSAALGTGTVTACFSEMTGGVPLATVDPGALNGVQWILIPPTDAAVVPCHATFTVSNVSFVADATCL